MNRENGGDRCVHDGTSPVSADGVIPQLDLLWDPVKVASNQIKHGVTFAQAATVLLDALALDGIRCRTQRI